MLGQQAESYAGRDVAPAPGARVPVPIARHRGQHPDDGAARVAVAGLVLYLVDGLAYFPAGRVLPVGFCRVHGFVTSRFLVLLNLNPRGVFRRTARRLGGSEAQGKPSRTIGKKKRDRR